MWFFGVRCCVSRVYSFVCCCGLKCIKDVFVMIVVIEFGKGVVDRVIGRILMCFCSFMLLKRCVVNVECMVGFGLIVKILVLGRVVVMIWVVKFVLVLMLMIGSLRGFKFCNVLVIF